MPGDIERVAGHDNDHEWSVVGHGDDNESSVSELSKTTLEELGESSKRSNKVNKITWRGSTFYTSRTLEEYEAYGQEMDEFNRHPPGWDDPNTYKEQAAELIHDCFPIIQDNWPQMADCELVETMDGGYLLGWSFYAHLNFKAKRKDNDSITMYFAEFDAIRKKVLCFREIDADPGTRSDPRCIHCHPEDACPYAGHVLPSC